MAGAGWSGPPRFGPIKVGPITETTPCPYCPQPQHKWKTLRGMKDHVRAKHPQKYQAWLLAAGLRGLTRQEKQAAHLARIRNDESLTAARYDEIIKLRMLLLDIMETAECDLLRRRIEKAAAGWGKKGDCV